MLFSALLTVFMSALLVVADPTTHITSYLTITMIRSSTSVVATETMTGPVPYSIQTSTPVTISSSSEVSTSSKTTITSVITITSSSSKPATSGVSTTSAYAPPSVTSGTFTTSYIPSGSAPVPVSNSTASASPSPVPYTAGASSLIANQNILLASMASLLGMLLTASL